MNEVVAVTKPAETRPTYERPRIQEMSEREILNTFQVTQAMQTWWVTGC
jgi:hypothetical protein